MTSAVGAAQDAPRRQSTCAAPPGLDDMLSAYPRLTPWANLSTRLTALGNDATAV